MSESFDAEAFKAAWYADPQEAIADLEERTRRSGWTNLPDVVVTIAKHHTRLGQPEQARAWLYPLLDRINDGYVALHLANTFRFDESVHDFDEGLGHAQRALTLARGERDGPLALASLLALCEFMEATNAPKQALEYAGEAMGIAEALGSDAATIEPLVALSRLHMKNGVRGKAEAQAQRAAYRSEGTGQALERAFAAMALAYARSDAGAAERAVELAAEEHHLPLKARAHHLRSLAAGSQEAEGNLTAFLYPPHATP